MAIILDGPVTPSDGTVFIRNVPAQADAAALDALMPDVYDQSLEVDFTVVSRRGNTARFRAHDAPAHINPRDQLTINRAPLVPLTGSKPVLGENELARLYGLHYANDPKAALADAIYDDLTASALDVKRRAQQAKGAVLSTGLFAINEGGMNGTIDYGVPAGNKLTAPTLWSTTATADIVTFLNTARQAYVALNGFAPGRALTTTPVLNLMQQNANLQKMAVQQLGGGQLGGYQGLLPQNAVAAILGNYNLPNPTAYICDAQVSVDGTNVPLVPQNVFILLPPEGTEIGRMQWGPTVTAQKLVASGNLHAVDGVPGAIGFVDQGDEFPYKQRSIVDSLGLPAVTNAYGLMILTVS